MAEEESTIRFLGEDKVTPVLQKIGGSCDDLRQEFATMFAGTEKHLTSLAGKIDDWDKATQQNAQTQAVTNQELQKQSGIMQTLEGKISGAAKQMLAFATAQLGVQSFTAIMSGLKGFVDASVAAATQTQTLSVAFQGLTGDSDKALESFRKVTGGMLSDVEIMKNYNQAAQLVGKTFADQLPEAMGMLQKVAGSTGQSMDYMLNSLIRGVGRLSPMILDNLSIQVSLEEATARAAAMFGVQADELSKTQQQAGMTAVVMDKLRANTASMGDVSGTAASAQAGLKASTQNLQAVIGKALMPATMAVNSAMTDFVAQLTESASVGGALHDSIGTMTEGIMAMSDSLPQVVDGLVSFVELLGQVASALAALDLTGESPIAKMMEDFTNTSGIMDLVVMLEKSPPLFLAGVTGAQALVDAFRLIESQVNETSAAAQQESGIIASSMGKMGIAASRESGVVARMMGQVAASTVQASAQVASSGAEMSEEMAKALEGMNTAWQQGSTQIEAVAQNHYKAIAQLAQNYQMTSIRAEAEYNSKRAALVAKGMTEAVTQLDAGYQKAKIMRDLDYKIAVAQEQAKYAAELKIQEAAFGQKIALYVMENQEKLQITTTGMSNILVALGSAFGEEVRLRQELVNDILKLATLQTDIEDTQTHEQIRLINQRIEAHKKELAAIAAKNAAASGFDPSQFAADIQAAMDRVTSIDVAAGVGDFSTSTGGVKATEKRAEEVLADVAKSIEGMLDSIQNIKATLAQDLPEIPADVIGRWLDDLRTMTEQVYAWAVAQGPQLGEGIRRFKDEFLPDLETWGDIADTIGNLFSGIKSIHDTASTKLATMKTSVAEFFDALQGVFWDVQAYISANTGGGGGGLSLGWTSMTALEQPVIDALNQWQAGAEAIAGVLTSARSVMDALVNKLPTAEEMKTSVAEIFDRVQEIFSQVGDYVTSTRGMTTGGGGYELGWTSLVVLSEETIEWLNTLSASIEPLRSVLEGARSIFDALTAPLMAMGSSVAQFFDALGNVLSQIIDYTGSAEGAEFAELAARFEGDEGIGAQLQKWVVAITPIANILDMIRNVLAPLTDELDETKLTVADLFTKLKELMTSIQSEVEGDTGIAIQGMMDAWEGPNGIASKLERWNQALLPLLSILTTIKSILELAGYKTSAIAGAVELLFDNIIVVMEAIVNEVNDRGTEIDDAIAAFGSEDDPTSVRSRLNKLGETLGMLQPILDAMAGVCDTVGSRWANFRINIKEMLNAILSGFRGINEWFTSSVEGVSNADAMDQAVADYETLSETHLEDMADAMTSLHNNIQTCLNSASGLGPDVDTLRNDLNLFRVAMEHLRGELDKYVAQSGGINTSVGAYNAAIDAMPDITIPTIPSVPTLPTAAGDATALGGAVEGGAAATTSIIPADTQAMMGNLVLARDQVSAWLAENEGSFMEVFGRLSEVVAQSLRILAVGITPEEGEEAPAGLESGVLMELITSLYTLMEEVKQPFLDLYAWLLGPFRGMMGSISLAGVGKRMADGHTNSFVNTIMNNLGLYMAAGIAAAQAFMDGWNSVMKSNSPSRTMIAAADNVLNSFVGTIETDSVKVYKAGVTMGESMENGIRDALQMHSPSDVMNDLGTQAAEDFWDAMWGPSWRKTMPSSGGLIEDPMAELVKPPSMARAKAAGGGDLVEQQVVNIAPQITFAGDVSVRSDADLEILADKVSRKLASRISSMDRFGTKATVS